MRGIPFSSRSRGSSNSTTFPEGKISLAMRLPFQTIVTSARSRKGRGATNSIRIAKGYSPRTWIPERQLQTTVPIIPNR